MTVTQLESLPPDPPRQGGQGGDFRHAGPVGAQSAGWIVWAWAPRPDPARGLPFLWRDLLHDRVEWGGAPIEVLIVEDDAAIADMYRIQLEADGYRVQVVATAADALTAIASRSPDLVLLDVLLPERDGFSVLEHLRHVPDSAPPIVILSNYGEPDMMDRGRSLGALDYFVKSRITPDLVSRSIPEWLRRASGG